MSKFEGIQTSSQIFEQIVLVFVRNSVSRGFYMSSKKKRFNKCDMDKPNYVNSTLKVHLSLKNDMKMIKILIHYIVYSRVLRPFWQISWDCYPRLQSTKHLLFLILL